MENSAYNNLPMKSYPPNSPEYSQGPPPSSPPMQPPFNVVTQPVVTPPAQVIVVQAQQFGPEPIQMACSKCGANIVTSVKAQNGTLTWIAFGALCICGCWLGCCLIPFCMNAFRDMDHFCPNCNTKLGTFRRM